MLLATQPGCRIKDCKLKSQQRQEDSLSSSTSSLNEIITAKTKMAEQKQVKPLPLTPQMSELNEPEFPRSDSMEFKYSTSEEIFNLCDFQSSKNNKNPTFLLANIFYKKSNNFAFLLTLTGDVFFFNLTENFKDNSYIWYRDLQSPILFYAKADLIVSLSIA
jgi:hypothetical protein